MKTKKKLKQKLTDAERHKRFVEMGREVGASDDLKEFDRAFKKVTSKPSGQQMINRLRQSD